MQAATSSTTRAAHQLTRVAAASSFCVFVRAGPVAVRVAVAAAVNFILVREPQEGGLVVEDVLCAASGEICIRTPTFGELVGNAAGAFSSEPNRHRHSMRSSARIFGSRERFIALPEAPAIGLRHTRGECLQREVLVQCVAETLPGP